MVVQVTPELEREFRRYNWLVKVLENTPWYRKHANLVGAALATLLAVLSLDPLVHHLLPPGGAGSYPRADWSCRVAVWSVERRTRRGRARGKQHGGTNHQASATGD